MLSDFSNIVPWSSAASQLTSIASAGGAGSLTAMRCMPLSIIVKYVQRLSLEGVNHKGEIWN